MRDIPNDRMRDKGKVSGHSIAGDYIPAYPLYVLAVLKALEDGVNVNASVSTHGYFYELLIKSALARDAETKDTSIRIQFLTHLAYEMFCAGKDALCEPILKESFDRYQEKFEVGGLRYEKLVETLVDRGMLVRRGDELRFRYPYLFFYFVANHLRDLGTLEAQKHVAALSKDLSDERSSDIIMFLVHLSHDPFVLKEIAEAAESFFPSDLPATLDDLGKEEPGDDVALEYVEMPQDQARVSAAGRMDQQFAAAEKNSGKVSLSRVSDTTRAFVGALQTIRIVGQIIRNYPGSLEGEKKAFLASTSLALGLRTLAAALRIMESGKASTIERIISEIRRSYPNIPEDRLKDRAEKYIRLLKTITAFGIIRTVSDSISARELEPTYRRVFNDNASPAMELVHASVALLVLEPR